MSEKRLLLTVVAGSLVIIASLSLVLVLVKEGPLWAAGLFTILGMIGAVPGALLVIKVLRARG